MPRWNVSFDTHVNDRYPELVTYAAKAHAFAAVIRDIPIPPHVKAKLDALNILRAVRGTTGIEGIELTVDEVKQIMESPREKPVLPPNRSREEQEARNAQKVMSYVVKELTQDPNIPLTEKLICAIHRITTKDINYPDNMPGKYRTHDVFVGRYSPPSGEDVRKLMREFVKWFGLHPYDWTGRVRRVRLGIPLFS